MDLRNLHQLRGNIACPRRFALEASRELLSGKGKGPNFIPTEQRGGNPLLHTNTLHLYTCCTLFHLCF